MPEPPKAQKRLHKLVRQVVEVVGTILKHQVQLGLHVENLLLEQRKLERRVRVQNLNLLFSPTSLRIVKNRLGPES
jgi:hypothetical protein